MFCAGDTVSMPYVAIGIYNSDNVFTVQLSDASGSFASPVNIGVVSGQSSGNVKCVFPKNTPTGTGYRLRFISSNVKDTALEYGRTYKIGNVVKPIATSNSPICVADTLKLFASTPTPAVTYTWSGPIGNFSTQQNPQIYPLGLSNNGNYVVTANLYGCKIKDTTIVAISNNNLVHDFAKSNSPVCTDDTLRFYSEFTQPGLTYTWSGPNNFMSSQQDNSIAGASLANAGAYILTVANGSCVVKDTVNVVITTRPSSVVASAGSPCTNENLQLSASSAFSGYSYTWSGPGNFTSVSASPTINNVTAINSGDYYVSGYYLGCTLKDTVTVSVKPFPAKPVANNDLTLCAGNPINLTATSATAGVNYNWTGVGNYTSSLQNPTLNNSTVAMSGAYIVTTDLNGCKMSDTTTITVKPMPSSVVLSSNSPVCAGATLQLNATQSSLGVTYSWTGPNAFTASTQNSSIANSTTSATGWYKINVDLNGCILTDSIAALVQAIPAAPVISYNSPICVGEKMQWSTATVSGATYAWSGPNGFMSTVQNPVKNSVIAADAGQYQATVTVNGCTSPAGTSTVAINPTPFVAIFSQPFDTICQGNAVIFTAIPNNTGGTPQYAWLLNGQQVGTGLTYSTTALNQGDIVSCEMTEFTKCSAPYKDPSNDVTLKVMPWLAPSVSITANPAGVLQQGEYVTFTASPVNGGLIPKYQWKRNGQNIVGATGSSWSANTLNDNDKISVEIISTYKCPQPLTAGSNIITTRVSGTGVAAINPLKDLSIYPNPNNGRFTISGRLDNGHQVEIKILNLVGQVVYKEDVEVVNGLIRKDLSVDNLPKGVYIIQLQTGAGASTKKVVIE